MPRDVSREKPTVKKPKLFILLLFAPLLFVTVAAACGGNGEPTVSGEPTVNGEPTVRVSLAQFIEDAKAARIETVEVDGRDIKYNLIGDEETFQANMQRGDTVREILRDAGIAPEELPPIHLRP